MRVYHTSPRDDSRVSAVRKGPLRLPNDAFFLIFIRRRRFAMYRHHRRRSHSPRVVARSPPSSRLSTPVCVARLLLVFGEKPLNLADVLHAAHVYWAALVDRVRDDIEDPPRPVRRHPPRLLYDVGHGEALVEQSQFP